MKESQRKSRLGCKLMRTLELDQDSNYKGRYCRYFFLTMTVLRVIRKHTEN